MHQRQITILVDCHKILSVIVFHSALIVQTCHHHQHPHPHSDDEVAKESEMQDALPTGQESRDLQEMRTAAKMQLLRASKAAKSSVSKEPPRCKICTPRCTQDPRFALLGKDP